MADLGFTLLPADDEGVLPDDDLAAAAAGALAEPGDIVPLVAVEQTPLGMSWLFNFETGRFDRAGGSPVPVYGLDALKQRCLMAIYSARYAHAVFSDEFGMEKPDELIGEVSVAELIADYEQHFTEALLRVEGVAAVENFDLVYDPTTGITTIRNFDVVAATEENDRVSVGGLQLRQEGWA